MKKERFNIVSVELLQDVTYYIGLDYKSEEKCRDFGIHWFYTELIIYKLRVWGGRLKEILTASL